LALKDLFSGFFVVEEEDDELEAPPEENEQQERQHGAHSSFPTSLVPILTNDAPSSAAKWKSLLIPIDK
jgi:hypothetical protein